MIFTFIGRHFGCMEITLFLYTKIHFKYKNTKKFENSVSPQLHYHIFTWLIYILQDAFYRFKCYFSKSNIFGYNQTEKISLPRYWWQTLDQYLLNNLLIISTTTTLINTTTTLINTTATLISTTTTLNIEKKIKISKSYVGRNFYPIKVWKPISCCMIYYYTLTLNFFWTKQTKLFEQYILKGSPLKNNADTFIQKILCFYSKDP